MRGRRHVTGARRSAPPASSPAPRAVVVARHVTASARSRQMAARGQGGAAGTARGRGRVGGLRLVLLCSKQCLQFLGPDMYRVFIFPSTLME